MDRGRVPAPFCSTTCGRLVLRLGQVTLGGERPAGVLRQPCRLVIRESTGPVPARSTSTGRDGGD
ncbi:hypothetical protein [Micromonospora pisi]|uniref:hypothetical protein n=1 Tax=Micromonospora pisi TaxID=589240 RepID=UPI000EB2E06C|nr:hypothetical protein [Micromonospora pisi]